MEKKLNITVLTENQLRELIYETVDQLLVERMPQILRKASRKEVLTSKDLKELTGMSYRMQKYHREKGNLHYSQDGRKIFYRTVDVELFIKKRRNKASDDK